MKLIITTAACALALFTTSCNRTPEKIVTTPAPTQNSNVEADGFVTREPASVAEESTTWDEEQRTPARTTTTVRLLEQTFNDPVEESEADPRTVASLMSEETSAINDVELAQAALNSRMSLSLNEDGVMGPQTRSALRRFQRTNGLKITGDLDTATLAALGLEGVETDRAPASVSTEDLR